MMNTSASFSGRKDGFDTRPAGVFSCVGSYVGEQRMDYQRIYDQFVADRKVKAIGLTGYTEKHHIVPRSLGGSDDELNLVPLTPEDHIRAHVLLGRIHGGTMWFAVTAMMGNRKRYSRAPTRRERWAVAFSRQKMVNIVGNRRGVPHSEETKSKIREAASKQLWWNNGVVQTRSEHQPEGFVRGGLDRGVPNWSEAGRQRIVETVRNIDRTHMKGGSNVSHRPEVKAKISAAVGGDNHYSRKPGYVSKISGENSPVKRPEVVAQLSAKALKRNEILRSYFALSGFTGNKRKVTIAKAQSWIDANTPKETK